jgi:hypothetical protein
MRLPEPTGIGLAPARVRRSRFFRSHNPSRTLPRFWEVRVAGRPGQDDMGLTASGTLVVSRRVLDVLLKFDIRRAVLAQYGPTLRRRASRPRRR